MFLYYEYEDKVKKEFTTHLIIMGFVSFSIRIHADIMFSWRHHK